MQGGISEGCGSREYIYFVKIHQIVHLWFINFTVCICYIKIIALIIINNCETLVSWSAYHDDIGKQLWNGSMCILDSSKWVNILRKMKLGFSLLKNVVMNMESKKTGMNLKCWTELESSIWTHGSYVYIKFTYTLLNSVCWKAL